MISHKERALRSLKKGKRTFVAIVVILSLGYCLLGQMTLSFFSFFQMHRAVLGDEVSIFVDADLGEKRIKQVLGNIQSVCAQGVIREIQPADILEKDILKLVESRKKIPMILAMQFPSATDVRTIREYVRSIEQIKGVEAVTANFEWIQKRHSLREAIALGIIALAVPTVILIGALVIQSGLRFRHFMNEEQRLLQMLGASTWAIRSPQMWVALWASSLACVIGTVLLILTIWTSVPLLEEAFETKLMPDMEICFAVCFVVALLMVLMTVFSSFIFAGRSKPFKF